ncbi:hypothetical protein EV1_024152 [Malus domestica]
MAASPFLDMLFANQIVLAQHISWTSPPNNAWKISFAGHHEPESGTGSFACIVRDHNAVFKTAIAGPSGKVSDGVVAHLTAFSRAVDFAITEGIDYLQIEGNHPFVFEMITGETKIPDSLTRGLVFRCIHDLQKLKSVTFRSVTMGDNFAANLLARIATERQRVEFWPDIPPKEVAESLVLDVIGRWMPPYLLREASSFAPKRPQSKLPRKKQRRNYYTSFV